MADLGSVFGEGGAAQAARSTGGRTRRAISSTRSPATANITVVSHFATANGIMTFNQLHPPFNNPAMRRALLGAVDQAEAMIAIAGADRDNWHDGIGLFGAGTPFANDVGIEVLQRPRDYAEVKRALAEAGYNGEKIVVMAPTDVHELGDLTRTGAEQLRRAGMNVDLQEMDFGSVIRRRGQSGAAGQGRLEHVLHADRPLDPEHPSVRQSRRSAPTARGLSTAGPTARSIEELRAAWLDAGRSGRAEADLHRIAEAAVAGRARSSRWANTGRPPPTART